jgi:VanZ family protein
MHSNPRSRFTARLLRASAALLYLLLIGYGSLYPFSGWRASDYGSLTFLTAPWPRFITRTDLITNVLAYLPLGYLLSAWLRLHIGRWQTVIVTVGFSALFSLCMELAQTLLPGRIASTQDIATNVAGALLGVLLYRLLQNHKWPGHALPSLREHWFIPGVWGNLGLLLLAVWGLSQLSLEVPSLVAGNLKTQFVPFWELPGNGYQYRPLHTIIFTLEIALASLFIGGLLRRKTHSAWRWIGIFGFVLACKLLAAALLLKSAVLPHLLSAEVASGLLGATACIAWARQHPHGWRTLWLAAWLALAGSLQWLLHSGAMRTLNGGSGAVPLNITALAGWAALAWPLAVLLFLALRWAVRMPAARRNATGLQQRP